MVCEGVGIWACFSFLIVVDLLCDRLILLVEFKPKLFSAIRWDFPFLVKRILGGSEDKISVLIANFFAA